jgi:hypothetical protein
MRLARSVRLTIAARNPRKKRQEVPIILWDPSMNRRLPLALTRHAHHGGAQMKSVLIGLGMLLGAATIASGEDVKIEKKVERPGVSVEVPAPPGVGVERRDRVETTGRATGCESKSVTKESPGETKTTTRSNC